MSHQQKSATGTSGVSSKSNNNTSHVLRRRKKKISKKTVLNMLAVMEASQNPDPSKSPSLVIDPHASVAEFLQTGRTGRRNAVPDIREDGNAALSSSDLPERLESLSTAEKQCDPSKQAGTSKNS